MELYFGETRRIAS